MAGEDPPTLVGGDELAAGDLIFQAGDESTGPTTAAKLGHQAIASRQEQRSDSIDVEPGPWMVCAGSDPFGVQREHVLLVRRHQQPCAGRRRFEIEVADGVEGGGNVVLAVDGLPDPLGAFRRLGGLRLDLRQPPRRQCEEENAEADEDRAPQPEALREEAGHDGTVYEVGRPPAQALTPRPPLPPPPFPPHRERGRGTENGFPTEVFVGAGREGGREGAGEGAGGVRGL